MNKLRTYIKLLRPTQWTKNLLVFIPIFFAGEIFNATDFWKTLATFVALCLVTSSIYVFNDIFDSERDKLHPEKKNRPIASGAIPVTSAFIVGTLLFILSLIFGYFIVSSEYFVLLEVGYFAMMILYSVILKHFNILDIIIISIGFLIRVVAGAIVVQVHFSAMLAVTIIAVSLLLSLGKRRAEVVDLSLAKVDKFRPSLSGYPPIVMDSVLSALFASTFIAYILFSYGFTATFDANIIKLLPPLLKEAPWLLTTVPVAFYVLVRYMILVYSGTLAEHPESIWWKDKKFFFAMIVWFLMLFGFIYFDKLF